MSILDFLKKDKEGEEKKVEAEKEVKEVKKEKSAEEKSAKLVEKEKPEEPEKAEKLVEKEPEKKPIFKKKKTGIVAQMGYKVLKVPHISEKATDLVEKNQYIFNVAQTANKQEIRQAIKEIYGVDVVWVNVINIPRRKRRVGKTMGWKQGYRKAIVKIKEGQKIELLPR